MPAGGLQGRGWTRAAPGTTCTAPAPRAPRAPRPAVSPARARARSPGPCPRPAPSPARSCGILSRSAEPAGTASRPSAPRTPAQEYVHRWETWEGRRGPARRFPHSNGSGPPAAGPGAVRAASGRRGRVGLTSSGCGGSWRWGRREMRRGFAGEDRLWEQRLQCARQAASGCGHRHCACTLQQIQSGYVRTEPYVLRDRGRSFGRKGAGRHTQSVCTQECPAMRDSSG